MLRVVRGRMRGEVSCLSTSAEASICWWDHSLRKRASHSATHEALYIRSLRPCAWGLTDPVHELNTELSGSCLGLAVPYKVRGILRVGGLSLLPQPCWNHQSSRYETPLHITISSNALGIIISSNASTHQCYLTQAQVCWKNNAICMKSLLKKIFLYFSLAG